MGYGTPHSSLPPTRYLRLTYCRVRSGSDGICGEIATSRMEEALGGGAALGRRWRRVHEGQRETLDKRSSEIVGLKLLNAAKPEGERLVHELEEVRGHEVVLRLPGADAARVRLQSPRCTRRATSVRQRMQLDSLLQPPLVAAREGPAKPPRKRISAGGRA